MRAGMDWEGLRLAAVPECWRGKVQRDYRRKLAKIENIPAGAGKRTRAEQGVNAWLEDIAGIFAKVRFAPGLSEGDIRDTAEKCAAQAINLAEIVPGVFVVDVAALRVRLESYAATYNVTAPGVAIADRPAVARMTCALWWRRALRKAQARQLEQGAITLGYVHKRAEIYCSDATVARRQEQRRRNAAMLEATTARNVDTGDEYTLAQLAAVSVANPAIRRGELITRIAGFESVAKGLGHIAEFVTLTAPSRFHRMRKAENGYIVPNPKHDGSSPRDAQKHLVKVWARIRAKLARDGVRVYGFRIAEPHHDACPHWHILVFMPEYLGEERRALPRFRAIFRRHALKDSGDEAGAKKYRVKFEAIDWARGSACGYVLKYIAKNIDGNGYAIQGDIEGGDVAAIYPAQRVEAWASTWGIRQFQQIGGPPVGVWRELRRMREELDSVPAVVESARSAADVGNWGRFVEVMGGPVVKRGALPLRAAYRDKAGRVDQETGEVYPVQTAYGEDAAPVVVGVRYWETVRRVVGIAEFLEVVERVAESSRYRWEIQRGESNEGTNAGFFGGAGAGCDRHGLGRAAGGDGAKGLGGGDDGASCSSSFGQGIRGGRILGGGEAAFSGAVGAGGTAVCVVGFDFEGGAAGRPRTRVNNCTRPGIDGQFCLVDFSWKRKQKGEVDGNEGEKSGAGGTGKPESSADAYRRQSGADRPGGNGGSPGA